jgi:hypothetical protein
MEVQLLNAASHQDASILLKQLPFEGFGANAPEWALLILDINVTIGSA